MQNPPTPCPKTNATHADITAWYVDAMERLVSVVQSLSQARSVDAVMAIVRDAARSLTGADGATLVVRDGDLCYYADENAIAPLWKGRRFPLAACISGWVMQHAEPAVIEDIYADPRVPVDAYRPTFVKSLAMVPIRRSAPIGAIGNYWSSPRAASPHEIAVLQALADTTSVALENADLYDRLNAQVRTLRDQQARIQEQRDTLEVFTRALAHDLKEPVRTMRSFSRMALEADDEYAQSEEDQVQHLRFVQSAADRMGVLIDSVFRYVQHHDAAATPAEPCPTSEILDSVIADLSPLIRERGTIIEKCELPLVQAHRSHVSQVLQNLITNAILHNERPVTVRVDAQRRPSDWLFSVSDNGIGIPHEHAKRVFQPFKRLTNRQDCAGLGLAICEKLIGRCGGTIWCEPQRGSGAMFRFTLPRKEQSPVAQSAPHAAIDGPLANLLLVDDRSDDLTFSRIILSRKGRLQCRMLMANGGEEALDILRREPIDLMLLDINMPGLDGFEVLERMRHDETLSRVAVVMCTGSDYEQDKRRAMSLGAKGYILKPLSFEALREQLEKIPTLRLTTENDCRTLRRAAA